MSPRYVAELFFFEVSTHYKWWCLWTVKNRSSRFEHHLIDVTPDPVLSRLEGLNNRMVGRVEMPGGVLVLRIITAPDMSTGETEAQVDPGISNFQTVLTTIGARCDVLYLIKMRTALCHVLFLPDARVRPGPTLILPLRDAGGNFLWSEPLHICMYDSSGIRLCMLHIYLSLIWGRCSYTRQVLTSLSAKDTIAWYSLTW
jgi:hypothetical protein